MGREAEVPVNVDGGANDGPVVIPFLSETTYLLYIVVVVVVVVGSCRYSRQAVSSFLVSSASGT